MAEKKVFSFSAEFEYVFFNADSMRMMCGIDPLSYFPSIVVNWG